MNTEITDNIERLRQDLLAIFGSSANTNINAQTISRILKEHDFTGQRYEDVLKRMIELIEKEVESPERRKLPVRPKERVIDEWAAVLRHQDEVNEEAESRKKMQQREKQRLYREELAQQRLEIESKNRLCKQQQELEEKSALDFNSGFLKRSCEIERQRELERKAMTLQIMEENLKEKRRIEQLEKERSLRENQLIMNAMRQGEYEKEIRAQQEQSIKQIQREELKRTYELQEQMKQRYKEEEKTLNKIYFNEEQELELKKEKDRQKYFEILKKKQKITDERERMYKNYSPVKLADLERQDELNYLKSVKESLKQEQDEKIQEAEMKNRVMILY